jgi:hypothetical protein
LLHAWHAYALKSGRDFRKVKILKKCPGFESGERGFCSSETKHDRRTSPRPKLFRRGDYRNKGYNQKNVTRVRILVKMVFLYIENSGKDEETTVFMPKLFFFSERVYTQKLCNEAKLQVKHLKNITELTILTEYVKELNKSMNSKSGARTNDLYKSQLA